VNRDDDLKVLLGVVDGYFSEYGTGAEARACERVLRRLGVEVDSDAQPYLKAMIDSYHPSQERTS
jgi:hypothetical protein